MLLTNRSSGDSCCNLEYTGSRCRRNHMHVSVSRMYATSQILQHVITMRRIGQSLRDRKVRRKRRQRFEAFAKILRPRTFHERLQNDRVPLPSNAYAVASEAVLARQAHGLTATIVEKAR